MRNGENKKEQKVGLPVVVWTCSLCGNKEYTTDPRIVKLHCPGCNFLRWMEHNGGKKETYTGQSE